MSTTVIGSVEFWPGYIASLAWCDYREFKRLGSRSPHVNFCIDEDNRQRAIDSLDDVAGIVGEELAWIFGILAPVAFDEDNLSEQLFDPIRTSKIIASIKYMIAPWLERGRDER